VAKRAVATRRRQRPVVQDQDELRYNFERELEALSQTALTVRWPWNRNNGRVRWWQRCRGRSGTADVNPDRRTKLSVV